MSVSIKHKNCKIYGNSIYIPNTSKHLTRGKLFLKIAFPVMKIYSTYQMPPGEEELKREEHIMGKRVNTKPNQFSGGMKGNCKRPWKVY